MKTLFGALILALALLVAVPTESKAGGVDKVFYSVGSTITTTTNSPAFVWSTQGGVYLYLDITNFSTTDTLTVKLQAEDPASQKFVDVPGASWAAKTASGTSMLAIGLGNTASSNVAVNQLMPFEFRFVFTFAGPAGTITFSLGGNSPSTP